MAIDALKVVSELTTLDLLIWRHYKREVIGLIDDTLARNPGLAALGLFLPVGTTVLVKTPDPAPTGRTAVPVITLYN